MTLAAPAHGLQVLTAAISLAALALAGCTLPPSEVGSFQGSLVLAYTLRNDSGQPLPAEPGHHCGTAEVVGGRLRVDRDAYDALDRPDRLLVLDPTLQGSWVTSGEQPVPARFPETIRPFGIGAGTGPALATIDWTGEKGWTRVDGRSVSLPHEWTASDPGNWTATLRLEEGPGRLTVYGPRSCE